MVIDKAKEVVFQFLDGYLVRRNLDEVLPLFAPQIQWVGTGKTELANGKRRVTALLKDEIAQEPKGFGYHCRSVEGQVVPGGNVIFLIDSVITQGTVSMDTRMTIVCAEEEGEWKITSVHGSTPATHQNEGAYFPTATAGDFARKVGVKTLDLMEKSIHGGILGTYLKPNFPIYYINNRMLEHLGYHSLDEFIAATDGKYINALPIEDRDRVRKLAEEVTSKGVDYEIQYQICKRDGTRLWVNDMGRRAISEDGQPLSISVVKDITDEVEHKLRLKEDAEEKALRANRYDRLFQSVLCGIVQYSLGENGMIVFEKANKEAIRIFGYEPEEFWAKTHWNLADLIAPEDRERVLSEVSQFAKAGDKSTYEYRLQQKDGTPCWIIGSADIVLNDRGEEVIQSVYLDIDTRKRAEISNRLLTEQVEASNELLRLALEHTTTCDCYYYPEKKLLVMPKRAREYYGTPGEYRDMPQTFADDKVAPEFRQEFCQVLRRIDKGEGAAAMEFRVKDTDNWCRATFSVVQCQGEKKPDLAVGIFEDITREKNMEQALNDAHSRDSLTGLYNKDYGISLVKECLEHRGANECYAMMLLDMDDLRRINRDEGTPFADAILQEVADILIDRVGDNGICLRLGGDEFMVLVKNCTKADAGMLGPEIAERVKNIFISPDKDLGISVSIGMCVTDVVEDYPSLYRCAESTLKYVKEHAKGTAACYLDTSAEVGTLLTNLYTERHPVNAIVINPGRRSEDLVSFTLDILGKAKNIDDAVYLLFARIAKTLGLDRVSILDANRELLSFTYAYQWAKKPGCLLVGNEFYVTQEEFDTISTLYDYDGLSSQILDSDFTTLTSCLHAGIWNYGEYTGTMSFEVDEADYQWSEEQRKLLKELVKIVPSFLMKVKADAISKAKTEFLSRMSHEIRTPMNAISGMTTIAKNVIEDKEKALDCLEKIESANSYLLELINDILDMSRIESGKMEISIAPLDLNRHLMALESLLLPQALAKGLTLKFENNYKDNRQVMGDSLRLNQVLINIIGNAIKFTPEGGEVSVRVEQEENPDVAQLTFSVRDTGVGIDPAETKLIFNAFEQGGHTVGQGGTGLGLAISSRLVQLMGGQLEVESEVGVGSQFRFTLGLEYAKVEAAPVDIRGEDVPLRDFTGLRLLVAEDNEVNREIVQGILEMEGLIVECTVDGSQALEQYKSKDPGYYDAVLMDIQMPVMDGLEATRRIRTSGRLDARTIPIIALTANAFDEDSRKSLESGMNGHLAKPLQVTELFATLSDCIK